MRWLWWCQEPYEGGEIDDIRGHLRDGSSGRPEIQALRIGIQNAARIFGRCIEHAPWRRVALIRKQFIGYTLFDAGGFGDEHQQGLILRLPTKARDRSVVRADIKSTADAKARPGSFR